MDASPRFAKLVFTLSLSSILPQSFPFYSHSFCMPGRLAFRSLATFPIVIPTISPFIIHCPIAKKLLSVLAFVARHVGAAWWPSMEVIAGAALGMASGLAAWRLLAPTDFAVVKVSVCLFRKWVCEPVILIPAIRHLVWDLFNFIGLIGWMRLGN